MQKTQVNSWIEAYGSQMPDNVRVFMTSLIDFELARAKPVVTKIQALDYFLADKRFEFKPPAMPVNDNPVEMQTNSGFKTIVREFKPQRRLSKRVCKCPDDYRPLCIGTDCRSVKSLSAFLLTGMELPTSFQTHRFMLLPTSPIFLYREA